MNLHYMKNSRVKQIGVIRTSAFLLGQGVKIYAHSIITIMMKYKN